MESTLQAAIGDESQNEIFIESNGDENVFGIPQVDIDAILNNLDQTRQPEEQE